MSSPNVSKSDQNNFSSPVPIIGLYIAAASMVCFIFILWDIILAIRGRKTWLPCRLFSLNSVSLTLLSIAAKLPVDLTTEMPTLLDQFSKLTGTILICVSMAFIFPSLGANESSECMTNMIALSIFVITVIVNICIQMSTGVITSFIPELVITMSFMLILLCLLWGLTFILNDEKDRESMQKNKEIFEKGKTIPRTRESMLDRLKTCFVYGYDKNPQFSVCRNVSSSISCVISSLCSVIVFQSIFRSFKQDGFKFLTGSSDYGWSMSFIVGSQILLTLLGSVATCFRGLIMWDILSFDNPFSSLKYIENARRHKLESHPCLYYSVKDRLSDLTKLIAYGVFVFIVFIFSILGATFYNKATKPMCSSWCGKHVCNCVLLQRSSSSDGVDECRRLLPGDHPADSWTLKKCWVDLKRLMEVNRSGSSVPVRQLLLKYPGSQAGRSLSSLRAVLFARITSVSLPSLGDSLTKILDEVFDVIHFVDSRLNSSDPIMRQKWRLAKALWKGKDFSILLPKIPKRSESQSDLQRATQIIKEMLHFIPHSCLDEGVSLTEFNVPDIPLGCFASVQLLEFNVPLSEHKSVEDLRKYIEEHFAYVLHALLLRLPDAIFKEISESPIEDYDEHVRFVLKLLCRMEPLDGIVPWSFPISSGITCMTTDRHGIGHGNNIPTRQNISQVVANAARYDIVAAATEDSDRNVHSVDTDLDKIIEVD